MTSNGQWGLKPAFGWAQKRKVDDDRHDDDYHDRRYDDHDGRDGHGSGRYVNNYGPEPHGRYDDHSGGGRYHCRDGGRGCGDRTGGSKYDDHDGRDGRESGRYVNNYGREPHGRYDDRSGGRYHCRDGGRGRGDRTGDRGRG